MEVTSPTVESWTHCYEKNKIFMTFSSGKCGDILYTAAKEGLSSSHSPISRFVFRPLLTEEVLGYLTQVITRFKEEFVIY